MTINYTNPNVAAQLSSGPTLLVIPAGVAEYLKFNNSSDVLTREFLSKVCVEDTWKNWYKQQLILGGISQILDLMPEVYVNLITSNKNLTNNVTRAYTSDSDTTPLEVTISKVVSSKADSRYIAIFNKDITNVKPQELMTVLNGGLLKTVGVDIFTRINRGHIFKNSLIQA